MRERSLRYTIYRKIFETSNAKTQTKKKNYHHHQRDAVQKLANVKQAVSTLYVRDNNSLNSLNHWLLVVGSRVRLFCVIGNVFDIHTTYRYFFQDRSWVTLLLWLHSVYLWYSCQIVVPINLISCAICWQLATYTIHRNLFKFQNNLINHKDIYF